MKTDFLNIANNLQGFTSHSAPQETYRPSSTKVIMIAKIIQSPVYFAPIANHYKVL